MFSFRNNKRKKKRISAEVSMHALGWLPASSVTISLMGSCNCQLWTYWKMEEMEKRNPVTNTEPCHPLSSGAISIEVRSFLMQKECEEIRDFGRSFSFFTLSFICTLKAITFALTMHPARVLALIYRTDTTWTFQNNLPTPLFVCQYLLPVQPSLWFHNKCFCPLGS